MQFAPLAGRIENVKNTGPARSLENPEDETNSLNNIVSLWRTCGEYREKREESAQWSATSWYPYSADLRRFYKCALRDDWFRLQESKKCSALYFFSFLFFFFFGQVKSGDATCTSGKMEEIRQVARRYTLPFSLWHVRRTLIPIGKISRERIAAISRSIEFRVYNRTIGCCSPLEMSEFSCAIVEIAINYKSRVNLVETFTREYSSAFLNAIFRDISLLDGIHNKPAEWYVKNWRTTR